MDSEPVAYLIQDKEDRQHGFRGSLSQHSLKSYRDKDIAKYELSQIPLYAAPPAPVAAPEEMEPTIEAIKRILPTSNPDEYAACIGADMWNACRAAMLAPGVMYDPRTATTGSAAMQSFGNSEQPVSPRYMLPDGWIKCSERMPENMDTVIISNGIDRGQGWWGGDSWQSWSRYDSVPDEVTHWMPLPAAPEQEV
jgi:hypothetical protein